MREEYDVSGLKTVSSHVPNVPRNPLHRPKVRYKPFVGALTGFVLLLILVFLAGGVLFSGFEELWFGRVLLCVAAAVVYLSVIAKKAVIWLVHFYQNKAPEKMRLLCVFEPSCSEYMILAVEKYGVIRGVFRGIRRIMRCHPPNGGRDDP